MDAFLISKYDDAMMWAQRCGINLLWVKFLASFAVFVLVVADAMQDGFLWRQVFFVVLNGTIFGILAFARYYEWAIWHDYTDVVRRMQALNARVLRDREAASFRYMFLSLFFILFIVMQWALWYLNEKTIAQPIIDTVLYIVWGSAYYLDCCVFLGPGDFSRRESRSEARNVVQQRT